MPINMACPSCGKTLAAPDMAAGKRAKCPGCGQIMVVPEASAPTDESSEASASSFGSQPALAAEENWQDDLAAPNQTVETVTSAPDSAPRRPCPECGEMIPATAARCRFCGAVFDPRLYRSNQRYGKGQSFEGFAVTSMVTGILAVPGMCLYVLPGVLLGIIAIIFGTVAMKGMAKSGNDRGKGMAVAGLVLGIVVSTITVLLVLFALFAFAMMSRHF